MEIPLRVTLSTCIDFSYLLRCSLVNYEPLLLIQSVQFSRISHLKDFILSYLLVRLSSS